MSMPIGGERPRTVGPMRAAAILYGDWGTSKAYVLGIAFALAGYSSFPFLCAMSALTALVALNYYWVCSLYPDGGGVYAAVRSRSSLIAVVGALLLIADYLVTASLSVLEGFNYVSHLSEELFGAPLQHPEIWSILLILTLGQINRYGPRHSGSMAVGLAIPASLAAVSIALLALPHLGNAHFEPIALTFGQSWGLFAGIVLALSGVEAVANLTGVMVPDPTPREDGEQTVKRTSAIAIGVVAFEVVILSVLLAYAMHAMPDLDTHETEAMLGRMASHYGSIAFGEEWGPRYAALVGITLALLLFSAANTAINGMISVYYLMSKDKEMPAVFATLNRHGVPILPLMLSALAPCVLLYFVREVKGLAALYAIGVVGAIAINLAACATNKSLKMHPMVRLTMSVTALIMIAIWITVGYEKHDALIFAITILATGLFFRSFVHERRQVAEQDRLRELVNTDFVPPVDDDAKPRILVCLRGVTDTLRFAIEEAEARGGRLGVLYVREVKVLVHVVQTIEDDPDAMKIYQAAKAAAGDLPFDFVYRTSVDTPQTILQVVNEYKPTFLILGASAQGALSHLLKGSIVRTVGDYLPPETRLIIYSWRLKPMASIAPATTATGPVAKLSGGV